MCLWRPFHECFVRLRRSWNTKSDLIDVFASFFLLSYCKILYQIMLTFDFKRVTNYSLTMGRITHSYILTSDFTISTFKTNNYHFILLACCTLTLILFFLIFPLVLLFFYPTKVFRNLLSKCCSNRFRIFLNTFIEKFQCCYRDGLDGGRDMRSLSGMYFLLRITLCLAGPISRAAFIKVDFNFSQGFILSVVTLLIALSRPYKKTWMNVVDSILLLYMTTSCYMIGCTVTLHNRPRYFLLLIQMGLGLPSVVVLLLTLYRLARCGILQLLKQWISRILTTMKRERVIHQGLTTYGATS